jgi:hypothetical protein
MNQEIVAELTYSITDLIVNINKRIDAICLLFNDLENDEAIMRLVYLIDDFIVLVKGFSALKIENQEIDDLNEHLNNLSIQLGNQDFFFISEILIHEIKPTLEYLGECVKNVH